MPYKLNPFTGQLDEVGSGTTLPAAQDGETLIYENGQWVTGPVIGGVSYTSAADPEYSNVQLLLHCNGTNGSTTFTDSSQNGLTVTANGNSQISTAQFKFGGASAYFDGASNGIQAQNSALIIGTGEFTIEMWFYASSLDGGLTYGGGNISGGYELGLYTSGLEFWTFGGSVVLTTTAPSTNAWHHVAITRDSSNVLRMFVDGALADSTTGFTENLSRNLLVIGTSRTGFYDFDGYVDDFRLTTGVARYTAAFTPPTAQLPGAGTQVTIPYSIDNLDDVDTSTVAPTNGQALVWDNTAQKWEPGTISGGVTSVTGTSPIASSGGTTPAISIQDATTAQKGAVQLTDSTSSTSTTTAATPNSVKTTYDAALKTTTTDIKSAGSLTFNDNILLYFGTVNDAELFCDGTHMYMDLNAGIGNFYIRDGSTTRFTFDDAGDFTATGNVTAYSDINLKEDIQLIPNALDKLKTLKGITYLRNDLNDGIRHTGVIAQEVEKVLPEAVRTDENGVLSVAYGNMIGILIEAIKEQDKTINELKAAIQS